MQYTFFKLQVEMGINNYHVIKSKLEMQIAVGPFIVIWSDYILGCQYNIKICYYTVHYHYQEPSISIICLAGSTITSK